MARSAVLERSYGSVRTFWLDKEYINCQLEKAVDTLTSDKNIKRSSCSVPLPTTVRYPAVMWIS